MLKWTHAVEVGHPECDRDHRQLITMVNLLVDALQLGDGAQALLLAADLQAKASQHCRCEQALLADLGADLTPVVDAHQRVADLAAATRLALRDGDTGLAGRLLIALEESLGRAVAADKRAFSGGRPTCAT